jgi:hypothetical protein
MSVGRGEPLGAPAGAAAPARGASLTLGLLAREEAIAPGSYPGGYFRLFFSEWAALRRLARCLVHERALALRSVGVGI